MTEMLQRVAAKGVVVCKGKVLFLREAATYEEGTNIGKWHFPGGRINPGESYEDGLRREIAEETGLEISMIGLPIFVGEWRPVIKGVQNQIIALFSLCYVESEDVTVSEEHDAYKWIEIGQPITDISVMAPEDEVLARVVELTKKGII